MLGVSSRRSCIVFFRKMDILTFLCLYVFLWMTFVLNDINNFHTNSRVHEINTIYKKQLCRPVVNLSCYQMGVYFSGERIFNNVSPLISDLKKWQISLQSCVVEPSCFTFIILYLNLLLELRIHAVLLVKLLWRANTYTFAIVYVLTLYSSVISWNCQYWIIKIFMLFFSL
jgi:hypothetical protein